MIWHTSLHLIDKRYEQPRRGFATCVMIEVLRGEGQAISRVHKFSPSAAVGEAYHYTRVLFVESWFYLQNAAHIQLEPDTTTGPVSHPFDFER